MFNPLAWKRTDIVRTTVHPGGCESFAIQDHKGRSIPFEVTNVQLNKKGGILSADVAFLGEALPSLGYRAYSVVPNAKKMPEATIGFGTAIENEFYRIEVDPARGGGITSLFDKKAKRELMNAESGHVGNEIAALEEIQDRMETQHEFWTTGMKVFSQDFPATVVCEEGPRRPDVARSLHPSAKSAASNRRSRSSRA